MARGYPPLGILRIRVLLNIVVDENIPIPEGLDQHPLNITRVHGRRMVKRDLLRADALVVRSITRVNQDLLDGTPVQFVASATAGVDHLDADYLAKSKIKSFYAAGSNASSVVDYVLCSLAAIDCDPRERSFGIIGCGQVGGKLYRRLTALGSKCYCYDPFLDRAQQPDLCGLEDLLRASDVVCLHTPLTTQGRYPTQGMLGYKQLELLSPEVTLISAGRGGVINEHDLKKFLSLRSDIRLIMDVWQNEPEIDLELLAACELATPHVAGYAACAKRRGAEMVFAALHNHFGLEVEYKNSGPPKVELTADLDWKQALLRVYDPRVDDAALRAACGRSVQQEREVGKGFDLLRKNYGNRSEISDFYSGVNTLKGFGFASSPDQ